MPLKVFVDSDVVISSLISTSGAAYLLLNQTDNLEISVSNKSLQEIETVVDRLNLKEEKLKKLIRTRLSVVSLSQTAKNLKKVFAEYVLDQNDAHIVAGAKEASAEFLVSYNTRHFKTERIKEDFNIVLLTPANFLQYLRTRENS